MRKGLLMAAAAAALMVGTSIPAAHADEYRALAVTDSGNGWGWGQGGTDQQARENAVFQCEQPNGQGSCNVLTSSPRGWYFAGVECVGGNHTAASPQNFQAAIVGALRKAQIAGQDTSTCGLILKRQ